MAAADCSVCPAGKYAGAAGSPCTTCGAGTYLADAGTTADLHDSAEDCTTCDAGMYVAETGGASCTLCPVNTFLADESDNESLHDLEDDCTDCPSGQPSSVDRKVCGVCAVGTGRSTEEGADGGCFICGEGHFSSVADTSECEPCAVGKFITDDGQTPSEHVSCTSCAAGKRTNLDSAATACVDCELGKYQDSTTTTSCTDCAAGKYGSTVALASPECSGDCERGSYCAAGSTSATEAPCPDGSYCAQGVSEPNPCPANYARTCEMADGELCPDNSLCLERRCSGLTRTALTCDVADFSLDFCSSLFAAGFRSPGDVGCEPGSPCANFHLVERNVKALYTLNQVDVAVEVLALVSTCVFIFANQGNAPALSKFMSRLNFYVFMATDLILQTAVMAAAYDSDVDSALGEIEDSLCWDGPTPSVTVAGVADSLKWIKVLGWVELLLVVASIVSTGYDRMIDDGYSEDAEETCFARMGVVITIVMSVLDVVFSLIDFFVFTVEGNDDFDALAKSLKELEGEESAAYKKCILLEEEMVPVWVKSEDNCLHDPSGSDIELGLSGGAIALIVMCVLWFCGGALYLEYMRRNPRGERARKRSQADIVRDQETELTAVKAAYQLKDADIQQQEESYRRLQEQRRQDAALMQQKEDSNKRLQEQRRQDGALMQQKEDSNRRLKAQMMQSDADHLEALKQARLQKDDSVNRRLSSAVAAKEAAEAAKEAAVAEKAAAVTEKAAAETDEASAVAAAAAMAEEIEHFKRQLMNPAAGTQL